MLRPLRKTYTARFVILLISLGLISGCAYLNPYIQTFNIIPIHQEQELGASITSEISKSMPVVKDAIVNSHVRTIGTRLVASLPQKDFNYEFNVISDNSPNAFTAPGGKIYVHTGLLKISTDAELAGVLAHEIGHAYMRHPTRVMSRTYGVDYLSSLIFKPDQSRVKSLALQLAKGSVLTKYGRDDEREADEVGFYLLKKSGLPAGGLRSFLKKIQQLESNSKNQIAFLNSHPPTAERIARLEALERDGVTPTAL